MVHKKQHPPWTTTAHHDTPHNTSQHKDPICRGEGTVVCCGRAVVCRGRGGAVSYERGTVVCRGRSLVAPPSFSPRCRRGSTCGTANRLGAATETRRTTGYEPQEREQVTSRDDGETTGYEPRYRPGSTCHSKVDVRLPEKGNSSSHGARPVHPIITMIKWTRTSRLSTKNSLSRGGSTSK